MLFLFLVSMKVIPTQQRFVHMDIKPASVLVSNSHYKSYKQKERTGDLGKVISAHTQTNALTGKNCATAVHRGGLAFMSQN